MMRPRMLAIAPDPPNSAMAMACSLGSGKRWMMRLVAAGIVRLAPNAETARRKRNAFLLAEKTRGGKG